MAGAVRDEIGEIIAASSAERLFSFFPLIGLLERFFVDAPPVGSATDPARERIRFRAMPSLAFPPADVAEVSRLPGHDNDPQLCIIVAFLGLFGPASPLPPYYTEELLGDDPGQQAIRDFLDIFNHRLISFTYKAWKKYRYYAGFSRTTEDAFSRYVFALMGMQRVRGADDKTIDWRKLMRFAGMIGMNCGSPAVLERVLSHYFDLPVRIEEAVERIVLIPEDQQHRLGGRRTSLGVDWLLGARLRDRAGKFRIWIGPVSRAAFQAFLPDGKNRRALDALVSNLLRDPLDFDVRILLAQDAVESWSLSSKDPIHLGWSVFLGDGPANEREVTLPT